MMQEAATGELLQKPGKTPDAKAHVPRFAVEQKQGGRKEGRRQEKRGGTGRRNRTSNCFACISDGSGSHSSQQCMQADRPDDVTATSQCTAEQSRAAEAALVYIASKAAGSKQM
ncbi:hypothetical protein ACOMHN_028696 [Nucella lapillus]